MVREREMLVKAEPKVLAFDIECHKDALKFPDAERDPIYMISYMVDGQGYLISSRAIVSADVPDFEYTPKPAYTGPFEIFNVPDEAALLRKFVSHVVEIGPHVFVTYNGDFFDWAFVAKRCARIGIDIGTELGIYESRDGEWRGTCTVHLDAFAWVNRDSYLPQGSRGLKNVTKCV